MTPEAIEALARKRASAKMGFYIHASVFCAVMIGLFVLSSMTSSHSWSIVPLLGWGLGLGIHGLVVFTRASGLRERMVQAEREKLQKKT